MEADIEWITSGGTKLALHRWVPDDPAAVVFYVHGLQSHAGWLFETGPDLASKSVALYVADRRGSGRSDGPRGDVESFELWIEDHLAILRLVRSRHSALPLSLLGQSLGGIIVAGLVATDCTIFDRLLFVATGLNQYAGSKGSAELEAILANRSPTAIPTGISDRDYTIDRRYLEFMKSDKLMLRDVSPRFLGEVVKLERYFMERGFAWNQNVTLVQSASDPLINNAVTCRTLEALATNQLVKVVYPTKQHYLEFSSFRESFRSLLAHIATA